MFEIIGNSEGADESEVEDEPPIECTDFEENIRNNILNDEPLSKEVLDAILPQWWNEEPYK